MNTNELTVALIKALHTCKAMRNAYHECALKGDEELDKKANKIGDLIMKQKHIIHDLQLLVDEECEI